MASTVGSAPRRPSWPADVTIGAAPRGLKLNQLFIVERGEEDFRLFRRKLTREGWRATIDAISFYRERRLIQFAARVGLCGSGGFCILSGRLFAFLCN